MKLVGRTLRRRAGLASLLVAALALAPGCMTILDATSSRVDRLGVYGGTRTWIGDDTAAEGSAGLIL